MKRVTELSRFVNSYLVFSSDKINYAFRVIPYRFDRGAADAFAQQFIRLSPIAFYRKYDVDIALACYFVDLHSIVEQNCK